MLRAFITKDLPNLLKVTFKSWVDDRAPQMAAALAFYMAFALAPLVLLVLAIVGFFFSRMEAQAELQTQLGYFFGERSAEVIMSMAKATERPGHGIFSAIMSLTAMIIAASAIFTELQDDLNRVWNVTQTRFTGWKQWIYSRVLAVGMIFFIGFLFICSLLISTILSIGTDWIQPFYQINATQVEWINLGISFSFMLVTFAFVYKIMPDARVMWKDVWLGAFVTTLLYHLGKSAIAFYLGQTSYASAYGAAGSLVVLLLWIYYNAQIFFVGAEFTAAYEKLREQRKAK